MPFVHMDDREATLGAAQALARGELVHGFENRFQCRDGEYRWLSWNSRSNPESRTIFAVARDVTEAKDRASERAHYAGILEASHAALEQAQEVGRLGSWQHDLASSKVLWSKQIFALFGRDPSLGPPDYQGVLDIYHPDDAKVLDRAVRRAAEEGEPYTVTLRTRVPHGRVRYVRGEGRARRAATGKVVELFGTAVDVTAELEREVQLREARIAAEDASRAKSEFSANVSHEIRTPMTAILGFADLLEEADQGANDADRRADIRRTIRRNGEHLLSILNDVLDLSKVEAGRMGVETMDVDLGDLLRDVRHLMSAKAESKGLRVDGAARTRVPRAACRVPRVVRSDALRRAPTRSACGRSLSTCSATRSSSRWRAASTCGLNTTFWPNNCVWKSKTPASASGLSSGLICSLRSPRATRAPRVASVAG